MKLIFTIFSSIMFILLLTWTSIYHLVVCTGVNETDYLKGQELHDTIVLWVLFLSFPSALLFFTGIWVFRKGVPKKIVEIEVEKIVEKEITHSNNDMIYEYNGSDRLIFTKTTQGAYTHTFIRVESGLIFGGYATMSSTYFDTASDVVDTLNRLQGKSESLEMKIEFLIKVEKLPLSSLPTDKQLLVKMGAININTLQKFQKDYKIVQ